MSDEDNKLFQTFGGRNKAIFVIVALLVAVAFFIAGAVMLGVGIHKANTKAVSCDNNKNNPVKTTAAMSKTTRPAVGSTNNPNTATNTITTVSTSTKTPTIVAKPFYLSVVNQAITADQLKNDFAGSVQRFSDSITSQLDGHPSVTILSVTSSNAPQSFMSFVADNAPVVGLVAVVYTSDQPYGQEDIKAAIKQNNNLDVPQIEDGSKLPSDSSDQLCNRVNPTTPATTQPTQPTLPSGQTTPSTKKSTVSVSTRAPASDFHPCDNRIVFAIDLSGNNGYYKVLQNFLINYVFAGNWNHLERLGLLWYSNRVVARYPFGYFNDNTQKNLDYVRKNINSRSQVSGTNPNLQATFQALLDNYKTNNDFSSVRYVVFVSQKLTQVIVDGLKPLAQQLNDKGGLALIALGSNVDQGRKYLSQLSDKFTYWPAPNNNPVLPNWETFFFNTAYGCEGTPPSDAPTIGTEPTITFGTTTTTQAPPPKPCDGRIVVMLDSGKSLTQTSFDQQKTFLGGKLFNAPTFDTYKRLALGYYGQLALTNDFGHVLNNDQVVGYLNSISYDSAKDSKLRVVLNTVAQKEYAKTPGAQVTVIIFVSYLTQDGVQDAKDEAAKIQQQGIRLILVAHGYGATPDLLTQVTGDSKTVTQWPTSQTEIPNYNKWLSNALNCPNQNDFFDQINIPNEQIFQAPDNDDFDTVPYPCLGNIIIGYDNSNQLSSANYDKQANFLKNQVFNRKWNNFPRLAMFNYNRLANIQGYRRFNSVDDIRLFINSNGQSPKDAPSIRRALSSMIALDLVDASQPSKAVITISKINQDIVDDCKPIMDEIHSRNCRVTFVAMGKDLDLNLLKELSPYVIQWDIDNKDIPDNWEEQLWTAYGCDGKPPTEAPPTGPTLPPTKAPVTTPKPVPYIPCNNNEGTEIAIYFDNSNKLEVGEYKKVINFLQTKVFNYWTHYERLAFGYYNRYRSDMVPGSFRNLQDVYTYLDNVPRFDSPPNVRRLFTSLASGPIEKIGNFPQFFIVFVSSITQEAADIIRPIIERQLHATKVTFVALKNADQNILKSIIMDVIDWSDMNQPTPKDWEKAFWAAYGCSTPLPTIPPPITRASTQSVKTTPSTPSTKRLPPTTTPVPFLPCKKQVIFMFDTSNSLSDALFTKLKDFIGNRAFNSFNHYERLSLGYYNNYASIETPGHCLNQDCIKTLISGWTQSTKGPVVRRAFQYLSYNQYPTAIGQTIVLFVGRMNDADVEDSKEYVDTIKTFSRLALIGVQPSVSESNLQSLADYSALLDLNNIPDNIDDILSKAYGCTADQDQ